MTQIETRRRNLEMQGFTGLDDATLLAVDPWLRLAPALCMIGVGIGAVTEAYPLIWTLSVLAATGALLKHHPFDAIYNLGYRRLTRGPRLPVYGAARRFSCGVAAVWLALTGLSFYAGETLVGYGLGVLMFALAEVQVLTGFCVPSWFYSRVTGRKKARQEIPAPSASIDL